MSILDNLHYLDINISNRRVIIINEKIELYNTDKDVAILSVRLMKDNNKFSKEDVTGLNTKLTVVKPKTNQLKEIDGVLRNNSNYAIYDFELPNEFIDQVGVYVCEITLSSQEGETMTFDCFKYTVKASAVTGLNIEIESDPDLPVLKQLIEEVRQLKIDARGIKDDVILTDSTWSSFKIQQELDNVQSNSSVEVVYDEVNEKLIFG